MLLLLIELADARYAVDSAKIKKELGWKPRINFEDGLRRMAEWYRENQDWWKLLKERSREYFAKQYQKPSQRKKMMILSLDLLIILMQLKETD